MSGPLTRNTFADELKIPILARGVHSPVEAGRERSDIQVISDNAAGSLKSVHYGILKDDSDRTTEMHRNH